MHKQTETHVGAGNRTL